MSNQTAVTRDSQPSHSESALIPPVDVVEDSSGITLYADLRKIHFFEPGDTGMNLSLSPGFSSEPAHALA